MSVRIKHNEKTAVSEALNTNDNSIAKKDETCSMSYSTSNQRDYIGYLLRICEENGIEIDNERVRARSRHEAANTIRIITKELEKNNVKWMYHGKIHYTFDSRGNVIEKKSGKIVKKRDKNGNLIPVNGGERKMHE